MLQCENCDEYFDNPPIMDGKRQFCSSECLLESKDKCLWQKDPEFILDHDYTMNY